MHTAIKIYKGLIEPHFDYCSAVWDGFTQQLRRNFKNFETMRAESSLRTLAMILVPDFFLTRLVGTIYRLEVLNKKLIWCTSALIISSQLIVVLCLSQEQRITIFATRRKRYFSENQELITCKRSFSYSGASLWNNLPEEITRTSNSLGFFKRSSHRRFYN